MKHKRFRYLGHEITAEEKAYIVNDVLALKEALDLIFNECHERRYIMTTISNAVFTATLKPSLPSKNPTTNSKISEAMFKKELDLFKKGELPFEHERYL